jgi:hypothetical protein
MAFRRFSREEKVATEQGNLLLSEIVLGLHLVDSGLTNFAFARVCIPVFAAHREPTTNHILRILCTRRRRTTKHNLRPAMAESHDRDTFIKHVVPFSQGTYAEDVQSGFDFLQGRL